MDTPRREPWPHHDTTLITDGGLETWLVFDQQVELAAFAAYPLAGEPGGRRLLAEYYEHYVAIAAFGRGRRRPRDRHLAGQPRVGGQPRP